ncbi:hypothetical protein IV498_03180 [Paenarthrobacter sp. Z7-10]|nr:hypothetical protein [Paenarthrobacter sp. Z7-10]MCZ2402208.1 hypothetical protein [Paenarthrobacter sp. Z7-10]
MINSTAKTVISAQRALTDNDAAAIRAAAQGLKSRAQELTSMSRHLKAEK